MSLSKVSSMINNTSRNYESLVEEIVSRISESHDEAWDFTDISILDSQLAEAGLTKVLGSSHYFGVLSELIQRSTHWNDDLSRARLQLILSRLELLSSKYPYSERTNFKTADECEEEEARTEDEDDEDEEDDDDELGTSTKNAGKYLPSFAREYSHLYPILDRLSQRVDQGKRTRKMRKQAQAAKGLVVNGLERVRQAIRSFSRLVGISGVFLVLKKWMDSSPVVDFVVRFLGTILVLVFGTLLYLVLPIWRIIRNPTRVIRWFANLLDIQVPREINDDNEDV